MQRCEFCGSDLPANAHFCGNCGRVLPDRFVSATDITYPPTTDIPTPQTPPLFNSPSYPKVQYAGMGWQDTYASRRTLWSNADMESVNPQFTDKPDEYETVLSDLLLPGMLAIQGQLPSSAQAPLVQGTPQVGGVPSVQGTPATPANAPPSVPGPVHVAGQPAPAQAPGLEPGQQSYYHQSVQQPRYEPPAHHIQPVHHPQPTPPPHELGHQYHHRHHTEPAHAHRPQTSRSHSSAAVTSKAGMGLASKWLIVALSAIVIIATSGIVLAHALFPETPPPGLTITGTSAVRVGGILHLHGQGFLPGGTITLTIDNGLPVSLAGHYETHDISQRAEMNMNVTGLSQMFIAGELQPRSAADLNIPVSSSGTFDANITVPLNLLAGKHTIHATVNQGSQSASLQFKVLSSQLAVNPSALNFGSIEVGRTVKLSVTVSNQGGTRLHWTATVEGSNSNWLTLPISSGVIETNGSDQTVIVTANTNGLSLGLHSATLHIHSDNSDVQLTVKINVIPIAQIGQQAILNVSQQNLDFGQLQTGQQVQQSISIANLGNLPLKWQASSNSASATWLTLATTKGTVQPGAAPQTIQVTVNTTGLAAGSDNGTINITSNGGNASVGITFVVTGVTLTTTPSSTPSQTPVATPTVKAISPASGPGTGGLNVTITGTGFTGATRVSFGQIPASNFTVKSDTQIIVISPAGSGTIDVTVTTPGGTSATSSADQFTYTIASPTWSVSPTSLNSSSCGLKAPCTVILMEDANSNGKIAWTPTSDVGATFNPPKGTLSPGANGQQQVSISGMACLNGTITFTGSTGAKPLTVSWSCVPPPPSKITVTPSKIDPTSSNCKQNSDQTYITYNCTVTIGETSAGNLNWFAPTVIGDTSVSFQPSSGQLTTSQLTQTVTIMNISCSSTGFTFTDLNNNMATVTWTCG